MSVTDRLDAQGTVSLLAAALCGVPSLPGAACRGLPVAFDAPDHGEPAEEVSYRHGTAMSICRRCPALDECRAWLDSLPPGHRPRGVIAGHVV